MIYLFKENLSKRWSNAAIWKWCDLDKRTPDTVYKKTNTTEKDNAVSRHELFPVRAPLQAMEHCIGKFLDQCDPDGNHLIELKVMQNFITHLNSIRTLKDFHQCLF